jgi:S1-C subfamily serine protease
MGRNTKHSKPHLRAANKTVRACLLCFLLFGFCLLHAPTAAFGQGKTDSETTNVKSGTTTYSYVTQNKDVWDKLGAISGFVSGIAVALIGGAFTYFYNQGQRKAEDNRNSRELAVQRVQTVQTFLPHLASQNELEKRAALLAIGHLDDAKLASELATLFRGEGAVSALAEIAMSANQEESDLARRSLGELFRRLESSVVRVDVLDSTGFPRVSASGFVAQSDGLIVTVSLLVEPSQPDTEFSIRFPNEFSVRKAQIVQNIPELKLLLLSVERDTFEAFYPLPIEDTLPAAGEDLFALSFPSQEVWRPLVGRVVGTTLDTILAQNMQSSSDMQDHIRGTTLIQAQWQDESERRGFAGMPTVNSRGRVVGIGYAGAPDGAGDTVQFNSLLIPATDAAQAIASISSDNVADE